MYHIEYRPQTWDEVVGHENIVKGLREHLADEKTRVHAYLFSGPRGTGKTTFAKLVAKELGCNEHDVMAINCNITRSVEFMRESIIPSLNYRPLFGSIRFCLFDEFHQATKDAQDALLTPLEEGCPEHTYFAFCSTEPEKIRRTIRSRCAEYKLRPLNNMQIEDLVLWVVESEKLELDQGVIDVVVKEADGIPREALVFLNMVKHCKSAKEATDLIEYGEDTADSDLRAIARELLGAGRWVVVKNAYEKMKDKNPESIRVGLCNYFKKVLVGAGSKKQGELAFFLMSQFLSSMIDNTAEADFVWALYECCRK